MLGIHQPPSAEVVKLAEEIAARRAETLHPANAADLGDIS